MREQSKIADRGEHAHVALVREPLAPGRRSLQGQKAGGEQRAKYTAGVKRLKAARHERHAVVASRRARISGFAELLALLGALSSKGDEGRVHDDNVAGRHPRIAQRVAAGQLKLDPAAW
ncbi:hypothetical protein D3C80_1888820 [compost metagenome]